MELIWTTREGNALLASKKRPEKCGEMPLTDAEERPSFSAPSHRGTSQILPEGSPASGFREQGGTWLEERGHGVSG